MNLLLLTIVLALVWAFVTGTFTALNLLFGAAAGRRGAVPAARPAGASRGPAASCGGRCRWRCCSSGNCW